jgi:P27 family predicted phage terminase small subunit
MGSRGPAPKPTALNELAGNPGKRAKRANEPKPRKANTTPPVPSHLSDDAKKEWRRVAKELYGLGLLTSIDRTALAAYCETFVTWCDALAKCREMGMIVKTTNGNAIQNPYLSVASQAEKRMRGWLSEFGMTPSSRTRISVDAQEDADPYEAFLSQTTPVPDELKEWAVADGE